MVFKREPVDAQEELTVAPVVKVGRDDQAE